MSQEKDSRILVPARMKIESLEKEGYVVVYVNNDNDTFLEKDGKTVRITRFGRATWTIEGNDKGGEDIL